MSGQKDAAGGQNDETKPEVGACGSGCGCGATGIGKRSKWMIGGAVLLAVCAATAAGISGAKAAVSQAQSGTVPAVAAAPVAVSVADSTLDTPQKGISESNVMAATTNKMRRTLLGGVSRNSRTLRPTRVRSGCGAGGCGPKGCGPAAPQGYDLGLPKTESTVRDAGLEATAK